MVVGDHAVEGCLYFARTVPTKEDLYVLQRVAGFGDPNAFANDLVEIHELATPQQVVQSGFPCPVNHCEAFERGFLIAGIVVNVGIGMCLEPSRDEVHGGFEG